MSEPEFNIRDQLKKMRDKNTDGPDNAHADSPADPLLIEDEMLVEDDLIIDDAMVISDDMVIADDVIFDDGMIMKDVSGKSDLPLDSDREEKKPTIKLTAELIEQINKLYDPAADYVYRPGEETEKDETEAPIKLKLDLKRLGRDVWKKKPIIFAVMLAVFFITFGLLTATIKQKYTATAVLLLKTESQTMTAGEDGAHIKLQNYNADTLANTIITISSLKQAITALGLKSSPWQLINNIKALAPKKTNTIELTATGLDPVQAAKLANAMADSAISANRQIYIDEANRYLAYFDKKVETEKIALQNIKTKLLQYTARNNIVNVGVQTEVNLNRLSKLEIDYEDTKLELATLTQQIDNAKFLLTHDPDQLIEKVMEGHPLKIQLINLESSLANAKLEYTEKNPKVIKLTKQVDNLRKKISNIAYNNSLLDLTHQQKTLELKLNQINGARINLNQKLISMPEQQMDFNSLSEERNSIEARLKHFLDMADEARMVKDSGMTNLQVASYAMTPDSVPKRSFSPLVLLVAVASSVFAGFGSAIIILLASFKISTKKELELIFDLPVFLEIEKLLSNQLDDIYNFEENLYQDAFRKLLSNLNKANKKPIRSIFVTSSEEGEGKTLVCYNLVKYLTKRSQSVAYLNLCPNNEIEDGLGIEPRDNVVELTDFFMNNGLFARLTQKTSKPGLVYIRTGDSWDKYLDTVESTQMQDFIGLLESQYEFVVIDCPAVLKAPDLPNVQKIADSIILVVESNLLSRAQITSALDAMVRSRLSPTCFILNKMPHELMSS